MDPVLPSWFKQRQAKAEAAGDDTYRVTAPNLGECFLSIRQGNGGLWSAAIRGGQGPAELASTPAQFRTPQEAWEAAFELFRIHVLV